MLSDFNKFVDAITADRIRDIFSIVIASPIAPAVILGSMLVLIGATICVRGLLLGSGGTAEVGVWIVLVSLSLVTTVVLAWRYGFLPPAEKVSILGRDGRTVSIDPGDRDGRGLETTGQCV